MSDCRILVFEAAAAGRGPGWQAVPAAPDALAQPLAQPADLALIRAESGLAPDLVDRLALPLIVRVDAATPPLPHWLDRADALLLPGDGDDVLAMLAARLADLGPAGVADQSTTAQHITALSLEAQRIADALASLARAADAPPETPVDAALVRRLIRLRRDRDRHFPADLFGDPAWDMLLDLTAARLEQLDVPVSSLCLAAAVPTTTALRWVRSLSEAGLFVRRTDPTDARRAFITLSDGAFQAMLAWLNRFSRQFQPR